MNLPDGTGQSATDLLDHASTLPYGEEERGVLHEALAVAQETGDVDAEFRIRLALTASYRTIDDNASFLTHFSAAVGLHDRDPQRFPGHGDGTYPDLFWQYKHAIHTVTMSCVFTRDQADAMLDQMATHFAAAGVPETAVDIERRDDAIINGHPATVMALQAKIGMTGGEDPFDDCPTCQLAGLLEMSLCTGDVQGAHSALMQILEAGDIGCVMEPETSLAKFMLIALENGDADLAAYAQRTSASVNARFQGIDTAGRHLEFLGVTGNHARGLGYLQRYQRDLTVDPMATYEAFVFLAGAWVLLTATERAGFGEVVVTGSGAADLEAFYGPGDGEDHRVTDLAGRCEAGARALAERYDRRNGNDNFTERLETAREHSSLDIPLDLGSTNLLLRAETATPDRTPPTGRTVVQRLQLALYTGALHTAADLAAEVPEVSPPDLVRFLVLGQTLHERTGDTDARDAAVADLVAELSRQGRSEAPFLAGLSATEICEPGCEDFDRWRAETDRLLPSSPSTPESVDEVRAWAALNARFTGALIRHAVEDIDPDTVLEEAHERLTDLLTVVRSAGLLDEFGQLVVNQFSRDLEHNRLEDPPATWAALREDLNWPHTVALDQLFAAAAAQAGVEDGFTVTDRLLGDLIDLGMREVTARVAVDSIDQLGAVQRFDEAAERADLAVHELEAAGLPTTDAVRLRGCMLIYAGQDAEGRELLEPLLLPKLARRDAAADGAAATSVTFSREEVNALLALGTSLKNSGDVDAAVYTLLRTRDLATEADIPVIAVAAVVAFSDIAHSLGEFDAAVSELTATLPVAARIPDGGWSELRLRDRIAVTQAEAEDETALTTLDENMRLARDFDQQIYVQESVNRVRYTFGRIDECLAGCEAVAGMLLKDGAENNREDAGELAAAHYFQGARYAAWAGDLPTAVTIMEKAVAVPGATSEQLMNYCESLSHATTELGRTADSERWMQQAREHAANLGE